MVITDLSKGFLKKWDFYLYIYGPQLSIRNGSHFIVKSFSKTKEYICRFHLRQQRDRGPDDAKRVSISGRIDTTRVHLLFKVELVNFRRTFSHRETDRGRTRS